MIRTLERSSWSKPKPYNTLERQKFAGQGLEPKNRDHHSGQRRGHCLLLEMIFSKDIEQMLTVAIVMALRE